MTRCVVGHLTVALLVLLTVGTAARPGDKGDKQDKGLSAKGQITLRKDLLRHLGVRPGEKIAVDKFPDGRIEMKAARPTGKISDVFGIFKRKKGPRLSIEEINEIAGKGWAGKR